MVWIHDNYLLLVPTYVRRRDLNANIGFFMHCPFPSSDIYKMFPYRGEVLKSLLLCDLIGFHLFEYARNFYTTCRRILGLNHEFKKGGFLSIECFGRNVMLRISHIGIQDDDIKAAMDTDIYRHFCKQFTANIINSSAQGKKRHIISSIDRFHPISGLKNKLLAYQKFMRDFPPFRPITCLVQYVVVSEGAMHLNTAEYTQTRSEIQALIKEIEEEFGKGAIHYQE
jgi:trehalose 6-phosphate synthase/phosphatase